MYNLNVIDHPRRVSLILLATIALNSLLLLLQFIEHRHMEQPIELALLLLACSAVASSILSFYLFHMISRQAAYEHRSRERTEGYLQAILDHHANIIFAKDADGRYVLVSAALAQTHHLTRQDMIGKTDYELFSPELADNFITSDRKAHIAPDGLLIDVQANGKTYILNKFPVVDSVKNLYGICGIATDITERKQAEEAARYSQRFAERIAELVPDSIYIVDIEQSRTIYQNDSIERILGVPASQVKSSTLFSLIEVVHPDDLPCVVEQYGRFWSLPDGETVTYEFRARHRDGRWRWLFTREMVFSRNAAGMPVQILGIMTDVTDRRQVQDDAFQREEQYRSLLSASQRYAQELKLLEQARTVIAAAIDRNQMVRGIVEQIASIFGYPIVGLYLAEGNLFRLQHQVGDPNLVSEIPISHELAGRGVRVGQLEWVADGTVQPIAADSSDSNTSQLVVPLRDRGRVVGVMNIQSAAGVALTEQDQRLMETLAHDIGVGLERTRLYSELRQNEDRYRALWAASQRQAQELRLLDDVRSLVAGQMELRPLIERVVEIIAETFGYTLVSLYLHDNGFLLLQHQHGYDQVHDRIPIKSGVMARVFRTGKSTLIKDVSQEPEFIHAVPDVRSELCVPLFDQQHVIGVLNIESTDENALTDDDLALIEVLSQQVSIAISRARIYTELQASEERYRIISSIISDFAYSVIVASDRTLHIKWMTDSFVRISGYEVNEFRQSRSDLSILHPDDAYVQDRDLELVLSGQAAASEFRVITKDGRIVWLNVRRQPVWDARENRVVTFYGVAQDITERKVAEEQLIRERNLLRTLIDSLPEMVYVKDRTGVYMTTNNSNAMALGIPAEEMIGKTVFDLFPEAIAREFSEIDREVLETGQGVLNREEKTINYAGEIMWQLTNKIPLRDPKGQIIGLVGTSLDITARKFIEHQLEEYSRMVGDLYNHAPCGYHSLGPDGFFLQINDTELSWLGYTREELVGQHPFSYILTEESAAIHRHEFPLFKIRGSVSDLEYELRRKDGSTLIVLLNATAAYDDEGRFLMSRATMFDITERKRIETAEREQRALAEAFRDIAQTLSRTLDLDEVLDSVLSKIGMVVPHDAAMILLVEGEQMRIVRHHGHGSALLDQVPPTHLFDIDESPVLTAVMSNPEIVIIPDTESIPNWIKMFPDVRLLPAFLGVPIKLEDEVVGFVHLRSRFPSFFDTSHAERLQVFVNQAAVAIQNARLFKQASELATMEERQRLARDLHDAVSQTLFSASVVAETLPRIWEKQSPDEVRNALAELRRLTRGALAEMRNLLAELRPRALLETDLHKLLKHLADATTGHTQIPVALLVDKASVILPPDPQVVFYRIAQEALSNIIKHARASQIEVSFTWQNQQARLVITDDGRGFDMSNLPKSQFGLRIMHERAQSIGATLVTLSQPGQGTRIELEWNQP